MPLKVGFSIAYVQVHYCLFTHGFFGVVIISLG